MNMGNPFVLDNHTIKLKNSNHDSDKHNGYIKIFHTLNTI